MTHCLRSANNLVGKMLQVSKDNLSAILRELRELRAELRAPAKRLLTVEEAAHYLGLAPKTIRNGLGPKAAKPFPVRPVRVAGRVLFKLEDLDQFVAALTGGGGP